MSPIAPSRSSFDVVPSFTIVTPSRPRAHSSNCGVNLAFVTTITASTPIGSSRSTTWSSIGFPPTSSNAFGRSIVSG